VVSSKKKSTVMSPIRRQMKKRNPSGGQNGQLVHWWVLIHSGPLSVPLLCFCSVCVPSAAQNCTALPNPKTRHEEEASAYSILRPQAHVQVRECRAARLSESRFPNPGSPGPVFFPNPVFPFLVFRIPFFLIPFSESRFPNLYNR